MLNGLARATGRPFESIHSFDVNLGAVCDVVKLDLAARGALLTARNAARGAPDRSISVVWRTKEMLSSVDKVN